MTLSWWCFQIPNSWKQDCVHQVWGLESRNLMLRSGGCRTACTFRDVCWQRRKARVSACWQSQHSIHRSPSTISLRKQTSFDQAFSSFSIQWHLQPFKPNHVGTPWNAATCWDRSEGGIRHFMTADGRTAKQPPGTYKPVVNTGFIYRIHWCRISSINRIIYTPWKFNSSPSQKTMGKKDTMLFVLGKATFQGRAGKLSGV